MMSGFHGDTREGGYREGPNLKVGLLWALENGASVQKGESYVIQSGSLVGSGGYFRPF